MPQQMLVKTLLNKIEKYSSFVYNNVSTKGEKIIIKIRPRKNSKGRCSVCKMQCPTYDKQPERLFSYVPLWGYPVSFSYMPRRVKCRKHGIKVEYIPWSKGKERITNSYKIFLAHWCKRISWKETAGVFRTSWDTVCKSVKWVVEEGMKNRRLGDISAIGIDEIQVFKGHQYMTVVYQLDEGLKRLLWCGKDRSVRTLLNFFHYLGEQRSKELKYICTDMWKPYLNVIKKKAPQALNILDRFHIVKKFNEAIDQIRRQEINKNIIASEQLKKTRWILMKNEDNLTENQVTKLSELLNSQLKSIKAYLLKKDFQRFWSYKYKGVAKKFIRDWCKRTNRTKLEPMKKVSKMLSNKEDLILNWFSVNPRLSSGAVEAMNNKAKLTIKKAYGFKSEDYIKYALYHTQGALSLPKSTHRFSC